MAQIAQQDHVVINCGESFANMTEEAKKKLRKASLRGTILDVVLTAVIDLNEETTKILAYTKTDDGFLYVYFVDSANAELAEVDCGQYQPEDYTDDVPYDGE